MICGGYFGLRWARDFVSHDAMSGFRHERTTKDDDEALVTRDAELTQYDGTALVHRAKVMKFSMSSSRLIVRANGVSDGVIYREKKPEFKYTADQIVWNDAAKTLQILGGIRVYNKDLDLKSREVDYDHRSGNMTSKVPITGKFYDGNITSHDFTFNFKDKKYHMLDVNWTGTAAPPESDQAPRKWQIKGKSVSGEFGVSEVYTLAEATDGEIIVKADKVTRDVKSDVLVAVGNVKYFSTDTNLLCERVTIFRKERRAVLEGRVTMLIKPKDKRTLVVTPLAPMRPIVPEEIEATRPKAEPGAPQDPVHDPENRRDYPVTVTASRIVYWYKKGERHAEITGNPQARQDLGPGKWRFLWASSATYNGETEKLSLMSSVGAPVRLKTSLSDDLRFKSFTLSTKEGDSKWSAEEPDGVVFPDDDSDIPRPDKPPTGGTTGGGTGGGKGGSTGGMNGKIGT